MRSDGFLVFAPYGPISHVAAGYGLIILGLVFSYCMVSAIIAKAIPQIRVVRGGTQVEGTMVGMQMPLKSGYRTERPVIRFPGPDGNYVRFQDLSAQKLRKQPGETVLIRYDPTDPKGTATCIDRAAAYAYLRVFVIGLIIAVAVGVIGILMLTNVIPL